MEPRDPGDIGLTGQMRLARIETVLDRMDDKLDKVGEAATAAANLAAASKLTADASVQELKDRVRSLELKFYVIAAGIVTAIGLLVYNGKGP